MQNDEKLMWKRAKADFTADFRTVGPEIHLARFFSIFDSSQKPSPLSNKENKLNT